jgi:hypothetical protein
MKGLTEEITTETFENFINSSGNDKTKAKYKPFNDRINILHLDSSNKEKLLQYTDEIGNEKSFRSHLNFCRLLQSDEYLKDQLEKKHENSYDILTNLHENSQLTSTVNKILYIRNLEEKFDIGYLNVEIDGNDDKIEFDNELWKMIKTLFRTEKGKPKNTDELKKLYLSMLKYITSVKFVIATKIKNKKDKNVDKYVHSLDDEVIQENVDLMLKAI